MRIFTHPRTLIVDKARHAFEIFLLELQQEYALSYGELFSLLGNAITSRAQHQIRQERHPDNPDKGGDDA